MSNDQHVVTRSLPSVQTRVTGNETTKSIVQAIVILLTIGITLTALYSSIQAVMNRDRWQLVFAGFGYLLGLVVFIRFWRWEDGLQGSSQFPRITAWLGNVFVNSWPWVVVAAYQIIGVPLLVTVVSVRPEIVVMFCWVLSLLVAAVFLLYRTGSELINPLFGNAIEIVTLKINVAFEKWKIERAESVSNLHNEIRRLESELEKRDELIATLQSVKMPAIDLSKSIQKVNIDGDLSFSSVARGKQRPIEPVLFARFIIDAFGGVGFKREDWSKIGVGRDDWEAMTNALKPWAIDNSNRPLITIGRVFRELTAYGIALPRSVAVVPTSPVPDVGTGQGHAVNQPAGG